MKVLFLKIRGEKVEATLRDEDSKIRLSKAEALMILRAEKEKGNKPILHQYPDRSKGQMWIL